MKLRLLLPHRLGDTVLSEPILRSLLSIGVDVAINTPYHPIFDFQEWPKLDAQDGKSIDLSHGWEDGNRVLQYKARIAEHGFDVPLITQRPRLTRHDEPSHTPKKKRRIGIGPGAAESFKIWPKFDLLAEAIHDKYELHAFDLYRATPFCESHIGLSLHDIIRKICCMDLFVSSDSGLAHLAAALDVPTLVLAGPTHAELLYAPYQELVRIVRVTNDLRSLSVKSVIDAVHEYAETQFISIPTERENGVPRKIAVSSKRSGIAAMRLDGLGGTLTLLNVASKIHRVTGEKVTLVSRGFSPMLKGHPAVCNVRDIGSVDWRNALVVANDYKAFAEIKIGTAAWIGKPLKTPDLSLLDVYENYPFYADRLDAYGLHETQLACKALGLPYDTIEMNLSHVEREPFSGLPQRYCVIAPGTDPWHGDLRQVKTWDGWAELASAIPQPTVQIGTVCDAFIPGCVDLRGKTHLRQLLSILENADAVVTIEGGIMHLSYALGLKTAIVLRGPTKGHLFRYPGIHYIDSFVCHPCYAKTPDWFHRCHQQLDAVCMKTISVERVCFNLNEILDTQTHRRDV